jgi:hypothetical protein
MWWGMQLWQYYLHFGDVEPLEELYPVLVGANGWFQAHLSPRGLLLADWPDYPGRLLWPWIDHGHRFGANTPGEKRGEMAALDALYYKFLLDAGNIARALGRTGDAAAFNGQAARLKDAINAAYWDAEAGTYWDDVAHTIRGEQASVLAVLYGIAPEDQWTPILGNVIDSEQKVGRSGPHFYFFVLDALAKAGLYDRALNVIRVRWGDFLARGATTWWEAWELDKDFFGNPWPPGELHHVSLAHGYSAAPTYFLSTLALGVRPLAAGFSRFLLAPTTTSLDWAEGAVPTPRGIISVSWSRRADAPFSMSAGVPGATTAVMSIPRLPLDQIAVDGRVVWQAGNFVPGDARLRFGGAAEGRLVLEAQPGSYTVVSR